MRYHPLTTQDRAAMLAKIGAPNIDALFRDVPKEAIVSRAKFDLPDTKGELAVDRALSRLSAQSTAAGSVPFFCGAGAYRHHVPAAVDHLIQRSEFLTSYTPYQPEIAQGTLQYLYEFQTQVALLTGMEVANASMYDGSTAAAEAVLMAQRITRRPKAILSGGVHPHYAETIETVAALQGQVVRAPVTPGAAEDIAAMIDDQTACVVVQSPDVFGLIRNLRPVADAAHAKGALLIVGLHRNRFAWPARTARRAGRGHCGGGRPVHRQRAQFRRALCRSVRHAREIPAADAGASVGRNSRCRRPQRLCAHALHARTAYPPRKSDEQHLHQFGAVLSRLHDPSCRCWARRG